MIVGRARRETDNKIGRASQETRLVDDRGWGAPAFKEIVVVGWHVWACGCKSPKIERTG